MLKQLEPLVFSSIVQSFGDAVIVVDCEGTILYCNNAAETLFGRTEVERILHHLSSMILEPYHETQEVDGKRIAETGMSRLVGKPVEVYAHTKDGREIPVEVSITPLGNGFDDVFVGVVRDISKQRSLEEQLTQLRRQFELILTAADEGIFGFDEDGRAIFVNPAAAAMLGYTEDEFIGKPQHELIHYTKPDGAPYRDEECPIQSVVRDGRSRIVEDDVFWKKDGTSFPVQYVSTPMIENGKIRGAVVYFRDITEQKKMSERLAHAVRIAGLGHWDWDIVNDRISLSDQMYRIFGLTPGEIGFTYAQLKEKAFQKTSFPSLGNRSSRRKKGGRALAS